MVGSAWSSSAVVSATEQRQGSLPTPELLVITSKCSFICDSRHLAPYTRMSVEPSGGGGSDRRRVADGVVTSAMALTRAARESPRRNGSLGLDPPDLRLALLTSASTCEAVGSSGARDPSAAATPGNKGTSGCCSCSWFLSKFAMACFPSTYRPTTTVRSTAALNPYGGAASPAWAAPIASPDLAPMLGTKNASALAPGATKSHKRLGSMGFPTKSLRQHTPMRPKTVVAATSAPYGAAALRGASVASANPPPATFTFSYSPCPAAAAAGGVAGGATAATTLQTA
mmetsp:Transcript_76043/g.152782  ORF Transcript_76043/g.152782 Transcript_76043/m.152782 type:complete len:285 (+) Transcript_76043:757-1611(+)